MFSVAGALTLLDRSGKIGNRIASLIRHFTANRGEKARKLPQPW
jgi:hypothetical protein